MLWQQQTASAASTFALTQHGGDEDKEHKQGHNPADMKEGHENLAQDPGGGHSIEG
jgi:hypothetical protein